MPVRAEIIPPPAQSKQLGFPKTLLYNGSRFEGSQKSKGNSYAVEVVLQVNVHNIYWSLGIVWIWWSLYHKLLLHNAVRICMHASTDLFRFRCISVACWRRKLLFVWLLKNQWTHIWISNVNDILRRRDYIEKVSILDTEMGCGWRSWPKTLGKYSYSHISFIGSSLIRTL